jgi:dienelactone hydrolase
MHRMFARTWVVAVIVVAACDGRAGAPASAPAVVSPSPGSSAAAPVASGSEGSSTPAASPSVASSTMSRSTAGPPPEAQLVEYAPDRRGFLYRPERAGPFPVVVWNHGSEKLPGWRPELGKFYTAHGWAFFVPHRRGHGRSKGDYIGNESDPAKLVALLDEQNADVVAAIDWIKAQAGIDPDRVVVSGCSFGGIQTMITAAKKVGIRAAVPFAPGAIMWPRSAEFRERLIRAAREAVVPEFLIQAANDYDLGPSKVAGAELEQRDRAHNRVKVYSASGTTAQDGHRFCVTGTEVWGPDVLDFLARATSQPSGTPAR